MQPHQKWWVPSQKWEGRQAIRLYDRSPESSQSAHFNRNNMHSSVRSGAVLVPPSHALTDARQRAPAMVHHLTREEGGGGTVQWLTAWVDSAGLGSPHPLPRTCTVSTAATDSTESTRQQLVRWHPTRSPHCHSRLRCARTPKMQRSRCCRESPARSRTKSGAVTCCGDGVQQHMGAAGPTWPRQVPGPAILWAQEARHGLPKMLAIKASTLHAAALCQAWQVLGAHPIIIIRSSTAHGAAAAGQLGPQAQPPPQLPGSFTPGAAARCGSPWGTAPPRCRCPRCGTTHHRWAPRAAGGRPTACARCRWRGRGASARCGWCPGRPPPASSCSSRRAGGRAGGATLVRHAEEFVELLAFPIPLHEKEIQRKDEEQKAVPRVAEHDSERERVRDRREHARVVL